LAVNFPLNAAYCRFLAILKAQKGKTPSVKAKMAADGVLFLEERFKKVFFTLLIAGYWVVNCR
jgi:hypothetical protein